MRGAYLREIKDFVPNTDGINQAYDEAITGLVFGGILRQVSKDLSRMAPREAVSARKFLESSFFSLICRAFGLDEEFIRNELVRRGGAK